MLDDFERRGAGARRGRAGERTARAPVDLVEIEPMVVSLLRLQGRRRLWLPGDGPAVQWCHTTASLAAHAHAARRRHHCRSQRHVRVRQCLVVMVVVVRDVVLHRLLEARRLLHHFEVEDLHRSKREPKLINLNQLWSQFSALKSECISGFVRVCFVTRLI